MIITQPFAAAVYTPKTEDRLALSKFAENKKTLNIKVGGVLQEALFNNDGEISGIDAIDVSNRQRIPISRLLPIRGTVVSMFLR